RNASFWSKRRVAVENLAERPESIALNRGPQRIEKAQRRNAVGVNPVMRQREEAEQPSPNGSLVISGIPFAWPSAVVSVVAGLTGRETAKPIRRQQLGRADVHDGFLLLLWQRADRKRHGKNLVRPQ